MMYVKCPECGEQTEYSKKNKHRPFCSRRCQLLDLGAWASEDRKIAGEEVFSEEEDIDTRH
tara:strand:+ start:2869 stop:3051 length:183 start_codon:yes stop_codon:yes gene_type:complete